MIRCLHCGAETSNGLALCQLCMSKGATCLEFLPVHFRNLARQRRPGRSNGSLGITNQWLMRRGETEGSKVQAALERTMNDLSTWARTFADDRGVDLPDCDSEPETVTALCLLFDTHLTSIATLEWAGQFLRDISRHEAALSDLTQALVPGWYAGECRQVTGRDMEGNQYACEVPTYVVPGLTWVTCGGCGATTYARDHLEVVLHEARDWVAPPMRIAEALVALVDTELSVARLHKRVSKWGERERIEALRKVDADGDPVGPKRYRLGDVLDVLFAEGPTRLGGSLAVSA